MTAHGTISNLNLGASEKRTVKLKVGWNLVSITHLAGGPSASSELLAGGSDNGYLMLVDSMMGGVIGVIFDKTQVTSSTITQAREPCSSTGNVEIHHERAITTT